MTSRKTNFLARQSDELTSRKTTEKGKAEAPPMASISSVVSLAKPGRSLASDYIGQVVTGSRDEAVQPIRSTCKLEECAVNRNTAEFSMPDEHRN